MTGSPATGRLRTRHLAAGTVLLTVLAFVGAWRVHGGFPERAPLERLETLGGASILAATIFTTWMAIYYVGGLALRSELELEAERHRRTAVGHGAHASAFEARAVIEGDACHATQPMAAGRILADPHAHHTGIVHRVDAMHAYLALHDAAHAIPGEEQRHHQQQQGEHAPARAPQRALEPGQTHLEGFRRYGIHARSFGGGVRQTLAPGKLRRQSPGLSKTRLPVRCCHERPPARPGPAKGPP